ncbi:unnamed protein product [Rotaria magnacalcarata]|uniref:Uncharacterized protein n=2 Tax=Rotaria magnacalcarata TaxID=392030 RepID=A0A815U942_9BILA|nr:unnamed protein product [Rotaria magnacalcarata]
MIIFIFIFIFSSGFIEANHFHGGTIRWAPIDPYANSSSVGVTIIQSYWWSYPSVSCAINVPISTSAYNDTNMNLTCVDYCSTDGGYSNTPVNILTDCTSISSSLGILASERSVNVTLTANASFSIAYQSSYWPSLNDPPLSNFSWSLLCSIDLRMRSDGFLNTPPMASVVSPQYVIVNTTSTIQIPVSDVNSGDDIRCRWSVYHSGYRRRRRSLENDDKKYIYSNSMYYNLSADEEVVHVRRKRATCSGCLSTVCLMGCSCGCPGCVGTSCTGTCTTNPTCPLLTSTTTTSTTSKRVTSSYPNHNPVDECSDICYPNAVPMNTTLYNCTITLTGQQAGIWYAVAVQVEDFINKTSTTPMSSIPVQFLIYVMPALTCTSSPIILPVTGCLEVQIGVLTSFNLSATNLCNPRTVGIADIVISPSIAGVQVSNLTSSTTNASVVYVYLARQQLHRQQPLLQQPARRLLQQLLLPRPLPALLRQQPPLLLQQQLLRQPQRQQPRQLQQRKLLRRPVLPLLRQLHPQQLQQQHPPQRQQQHPLPLQQLHPPQRRRLRPQLLPRRQQLIQPQQQRQQIQPQPLPLLLQQQLRRRQQLIQPLQRRQQIQLQPPPQLRLRLLQQPQCKHRGIQMKLLVIESFFYKSQRIVLDFPYEYHFFIFDIVATHKILSQERRCSRLCSKQFLFQNSIPVALLKTSDATCWMYHITADSDVEYNGHTNPPIEPSSNTSTHAWNSHSIRSKNTLTTGSINAYKTPINRNSMRHIRVTTVEDTMIDSSVSNSNFNSVPINQSFDLGVVQTLGSQHLVETYHIQQCTTLEPRHAKSNRINNVRPLLNQGSVSGKNQQMNINLYDTKKRRHKKFETNSFVDQPWELPRSNNVNVVKLKRLSSKPKSITVRQQYNLFSIVDEPDTSSEEIQ